MIVACEHHLFLATCGMKQKPEIPCVFAPQTFLCESLHHSHFAIMWLACSTECKQTTNTKGKECCLDVSSHFFGGSDVWHPRKRLWRRVLNCKLHDILMPLHVESDSRDRSGVGIFSRKEMSWKSLHFCVLLWRENLIYTFCDYMYILPSGDWKKILVTSWHLFKKVNFGPWGR